MSTASRFAPLLLLLACGEPPAQGNAVVEVGTGYETFVPVRAKGTVPIVCGPQGGQHIWVAVRSKGLDAQNAHVTVKIGLDDSNGSVSKYVCGQQLDGVNLAPRDGWSEFAGVLCYVNNPPEILGKPLRLEGSVTDRFEHTASATVSFLAEGPGRDCRLQ